MRGKSAYGRRREESYTQASMRPAHYAREVISNRASNDGSAKASMRPAHYAREVRQGDIVKRLTYRLQ